MLTQSFTKIRNVAPFFVLTRALCDLRAATSVASAHAQASSARDSLRRHANREVRVVGGAGADDRSQAALTLSGLE